ncbi:MAG: cupin domain-containing protein [Chloroflexi bacterium]|nr:cupin domain-containing protein [Chloroflexota bacterium]
MRARVHAWTHWTTCLASHASEGFHAVLSGMCWIRPRGARPQQLFSGDVVLLPPARTGQRSQCAHSSVRPVGESTITIERRRIGAR